MRSSALQHWKGQLTGIIYFIIESYRKYTNTKEEREKKIGYSTLAIVLRRKLAAPIASATDFGPAVNAARRTTPQSAMLGLHPVIHVRNYMDHYSFTDH